MLSAQPEGGKLGHPAFCAVVAGTGRALVEAFETESAEFLEFQELGWSFGDTHATCYVGLSSGATRFSAAHAQSNGKGCRHQAERSRLRRSLNEIYGFGSSFPGAWALNGPWKSGRDRAF